MSSISEVYRDWISDVSNKKSASAINSYRISLGDFLDWLDDEETTYSGRETDILAIDSDAIKNHIDHLYEHDDDYSSGTIIMRFQDIQAFFSWLFTERYIENNPTDRVNIYEWDGITRKGTKKGKITKSREGVVYVTETEKEQIAENVPAPLTRNELIVRLMWQTGVRASELVDIRLSDIYFDERKIEIATAKRDEHEVRVVWYQPSLDILMDRWRKDRDSMLLSNCPYLFLTNRAAEAGSNSIQPSRVNKVVKEGAREAGIQEVLYEDASGGERCLITSHALRHGYGVYAVKDQGDGGIDIRTLQILMGHSKLETTAKYLKFADETLKKKARRHGPS